MKRFLFREGVAYSTVGSQEKPRTPDLRNGLGRNEPRSWEQKAMGSTGLRDREKPRTPPDLRHAGGLHGGKEGFVSRCTSDS
eukprot:Skav215803  [mRNA]  locus=scaffold3885:130186:131255:+ [translate_table: standard]